MSDPTKFPQMHIAESVFNRIMNMRAELLPVNIPSTRPGSDNGGGGGSIDPKLIDQAMQSDLLNAGPSTGPTSAIGNTAIQGADVNEALAMNTGILSEGAGAAGAGSAGAGALGAGAGAADVAGLGAAGAGAAGALGAGASGGAALGAGAAVAGEAVATGAELLPLLALV